MPSLYTLTNEMRELLAMAESGDEGFAEALAETISAQDAMIDEKLEATIFVAKSLEADAEACKKEAARLNDRAKRLLSNAESCKQRVKDVMQAQGKDKVKRPLLSLTLAKGRSICVIDDESKISAEYISVKEVRSADKRALLNDLKGGKEVAGAHIEAGEPSLRIS